MAKTTVVPAGEGPSLGVVAEQDEYDAAGPFVTHIAAKPLSFFGVVVALQLLGIVISGIMFGAGYGIYDVELGAMPLDLTHGGVSLSKDKLWQAVQEDTSNDLFATTFPNQATRSVGTYPFEVIYESETNCLSPSNLVSLRTLESLAYNDTNIQGGCKLEASGDCAKPLSILRFFDGTYESVDNVFREDPNFARVREILDAAWTADGEPGDFDMNLKSVLQYLVGKDFQISVVEASTRYCRTQFFTGLPLAGYSTVWDEREAQLASLAEHHVNVLGAFFTSRDSIGLDTEVSFSSEPIRADRGASGRSDDLLLLVGTLLVSFVLLAGYTRSLALPFFAMLSMLSTYVWANLLYRVVCDYTLYALPQVYAAIVVLLVGTIDLCLLLDTFNDTGAAAANAGWSRAARMAETLKKVRAPLLTTALASAAAFFIQCASPLVAVEGAALFSGLVIVVNTINTFVFYPALLTVWDARWRTNLCLTQDDGQETSLRRTLSDWMVNNVVSHAAVKWVVIAVGTVLVIVFFIIAVVETEADRHQPRPFRNHERQHTFDELSEVAFGPSRSDHNAQVYWVFGLEALDTVDCDSSDPVCTGTPIYNDRFDLSAFTPQQYFAELCSDLRSAGTGTVDSLKLRRSESVHDNPLEVSCFIENMNTHFGDDDYTLSDMQAAIAGNPAAYPTTTYTETATFYRNFEFGLVDWLSDRQTPEAFPTADFEEFYTSVGGMADASARRENAGLAYSGKFGGFLRYGVIKANLTLNSLDLDHSEGITARKAWDSYIAEQTATSPLPLMSSFQTTPTTNTWAWVEAQEQIFKRTFQGLGLGLLLVAVVATVGSNNWSVGLLTTLLLVCVFAIVMGIVGAANWHVGLYEAVGLSYVPGIVAYIVVLMGCGIGAAQAATSTKDATLVEAMHFTGTSLLAAGSLVSLSILFLFGTDMRFSFQIAAVLLSAILFSTLFAVIVMSAVFGVFGSSHSDGRLFGSKTGKRSARITDSQMWDGGLDTDKKAALPIVNPASATGLPPVAHTQAYGARPKPMFAARPMPVRRAPAGGDDTSDSDSD